MRNSVMILALAVSAFMVASVAASQAGENHQGLSPLEVAANTQSRKLLGCLKFKAFLWGRPYKVCPPSGDSCPCFNKECAKPCDNSKTTGPCNDVHTSFPPLTICKGGHVKFTYQHSFHQINLSTKAKCGGAGDIVIGKAAYGDSRGTPYTFIWTAPKVAGKYFAYNPNSPNNAAGVSGLGQVIPANAPYCAFFNLALTIIIV